MKLSDLNHLLLKYTQKSTSEPYFKRPLPKAVNYEFQGKLSEMPLENFQKLFQERVGSKVELTFNVEIYASLGNQETYHENLRNKTKNVLGELISPDDLIVVDYGVDSIGLGLKAKRDLNKDECFLYEGLLRVITPAPDFTHLSNHDRMGLLNTQSFFSKMSDSFNSSPPKTLKEFVNYYQIGISSFGLGYSELGISALQKRGFGSLVNFTLDPNKYILSPEDDLNEIASPNVQYSFVHFNNLYYLPVLKVVKPVKKGEILLVSETGYSKAFIYDLMRLFKTEPVLFLKDGSLLPRRLKPTSNNRREKFSDMDEKVEILTMDITNTDPIEFQNSKNPTGLFHEIFYKAIPQKSDWEKYFIDLDSWKKEKEALSFFSHLLPQQKFITALANDQIFKGCIVFSGVIESKDVIQFLVSQNIIKNESADRLFNSKDVIGSEDIIKLLVDTNMVKSENANKFLKSKYANESKEVIVFLSSQEVVEREKASMFLMSKDVLQRLEPQDVIKLNTWFLLLVEQLRHTMNVAFQQETLEDIAQIYLHAAFAYEELGMLDEALYFLEEKISFEYLNKVWEESAKELVIEIKSKLGSEFSFR